MQLNIRGEQRQSIFNLHYPGWNLDYEQKAVLKSSRPMTGRERYDPANLDRALLRVMGLELREAKKGRIELKAYMDMPGADKHTKEENNPHFLGRVFRRYSQEEGTVATFFRIDQQARSFIDPRSSQSITIVNMGLPVKWSKINIALHTNT
jgi:hypothetical protein